MQYWVLNVLLLKLIHPGAIKYSFLLKGQSSANLLSVRWGFRCPCSHLLKFSNKFPKLVHPSKEVNMCHRCKSYMDLFGLAWKHQREFCFGCFIPAQWIQAKDVWFHGWIMTFLWWQGWNRNSEITSPVPTAATSGPSETTSVLQVSLIFSR